EEVVSEPVVYSQPRATDEEMKTMSSKEQAMEIRRRKIFDGACEVIGREGYAATTIRKVAKAAGVPISTMYQYIDTKEDLLFMITSSCMEEIFEYMTEELRREGDAVTKMTHAVDAYVKYISKNRRYINLAYRETRALSRANREKIFDIERRFTRLWEEIIISGNKADSFRAEKSRLAANMVYFFCNVWALRYWSVQDYTEDEVRQYLMKFVMGGLTAPDSL
ncbi:MAG: TetR/AcrR family transcriptional regulator, partial [Pseudomonadota bacterium]|nr:TetR/AcrR family transcriptional regulator [Pseudomonadota bacterium]